MNRHIDTLLACHDSMTMNVLLPELQSFHETEERGCHFEQVTCSSITLWTVRLLDGRLWRLTVQTCQDVPRHDITSHDLTWHSGTTLLPSSILCYQVFPQILLRASIQLVMTLLEAVSVSKELLSIKTHSFHSKLLPRSFWTLLPLFWSQYPNLPQPTGYQKAGDWTSKAIDSQKTSEEWRQSNKWHDDVTWNFTSAKEVAKPMLDRSILRQLADPTGRQWLVSGISSGIGSDTVKMLFLGCQPKCAEDL